MVCPTGKKRVGGQKTRPPERQPPWTLGVPLRKNDLGNVEKGGQKEKEKKRKFVRKTVSSAMQTGEKVPAAPIATKKHKFKPERTGSL